MELLRSHAPGTFNLVLTDVCMPEVNGIQLLQYVKQEANLRSVPVIMMSSIEQGDTVYECVSSGAEEYLVKPVTRKEIQHMWQHVLRKRSALVTVPQQQQQQSLVAGAAENATATAAAAVTTGTAPQTTSSIEKGVAPEALTHFLQLMRETRRKEAAELKRRLMEIDEDIALVQGCGMGGDEEEEALNNRPWKRFCVFNSGDDGDAEGDDGPTSTVKKSEKKKKSERAPQYWDNLEPLYFDRRRSTTNGSSSRSTGAVLDSLAKDLSVLTKGNELEGCASLRAGDIASPQEMVSLIEYRFDMILSREICLLFFCFCFFRTLVFGSIFLRATPCSFHHLSLQISSSN